MDQLHAIKTARYFPMKAKNANALFVVRVLIKKPLKQN